MTPPFPVQVRIPTQVTIPAQIRYLQFKRVFRDIRFNVAVPRHPTAGGRRFRVLVSQHGTRGTDAQIGADEYVRYPLDWDDPYWYDLVVVAPHFPARDQARPDLPNGSTFHRFDDAGLEWIHDLVHDHLQEVFAEPELNAQVALDGAVDLDRFYFFGQSRGGMAVHAYTMRYRGADIHRAASCAGIISQRESARFDGLTDAQYLDRLDAFLRTDVASVIGTADTARRIESIRSFVCREVARRTTPGNVQALLPDPPVPLADPGTRLACDAFPGPVIARRSTPLPTIGYRFLWHPNGGHSGVSNYRTARQYLFADRERKPLPDLRGWTLGRQLLGQPRNPGLSRLEADLEERADAGDDLE